MHKSVGNVHSCDETVDRRVLWEVFTVGLGHALVTAPVHHDVVCPVEKGRVDTLDGREVVAHDENTGLEDHRLRVLVQLTARNLVSVGYHGLHSGPTNRPHPCWSVETSLPLTGLDTNLVGDHNTAVPQVRDETPPPFRLCLPTLGPVGHNVVRVEVARELAQGTMKKGGHTPLSTSLIATQEHELSVLVTTSHGTTHTLQKVFALVHVGDGVVEDAADDLGGQGFVEMVHVEVAVDFPREAIIRREWEHDHVQHVQHAVLEQQVALAVAPNIETLVLGGFDTRQLVSRAKECHESTTLGLLVHVHKDIVRLLLDQVQVGGLFATPEAGTVTVHHEPVSSVQNLAFVHGKNKVAVDLVDPSFHVHSFDSGVLGCCLVLCKSLLGGLKESTHVGQVVKNIQLPSTCKIKKAIYVKFF